MPGLKTHARALAVVAAATCGQDSSETSARRKRRWHDGTELDRAQRFSSSESESDDEEDAELSLYNDIRERKYYEQVERRFWIQERDRQAQRAATDWASGRARRSPADREIAKQQSLLARQDMFSESIQELAAEALAAGHDADARADLFLSRDTLQVAQERFTDQVDLTLPSFRITDCSSLVDDVNPAATTVFLERRASGLISTEPDLPLNPFLVPRAPGTKTRKGLKMRPLTLSPSSRTLCRGSSVVTDSVVVGADSRASTPTAVASPLSIPLIEADEFHAPPVVRPARKRRRVVAPVLDEASSSVPFQIVTSSTPQQQQMELIRQQQQINLLSLPELPLGSSWEAEESALAKELLLAFDPDFSVVSHLLADLRSPAEIGVLYQQLVASLDVAEHNVTPTEPVSDDALALDSFIQVPSSPVPSSPPISSDDDRKVRPFASKDIAFLEDRNSPQPTLGHASASVQYEKSGLPQSPQPPVPQPDFPPVPLLKRGRKRAEERRSAGSLMEFTQTTTGLYGRFQIELERLVSPFTRRPTVLPGVAASSSSSHQASEFVVPQPGDWLFVRVPCPTDHYEEGGVWMEAVVQSVSDSTTEQRLPLRPESEGGPAMAPSLRIGSMPGDQYCLTVRVACAETYRSDPAAELTLNKLRVGAIREPTRGLVCSVPETQEISVLASMTIPSLPVGSEVWRLRSGGFAGIDIDSPFMVANARFTVLHSSSRRASKAALPNPVVTVRSNGKRKLANRSGAALSLSGGIARLVASTAVSAGTEFSSSFNVMPVTAPSGIARRARPSDEVTEQLLSSLADGSRDVWWWIVAAYEQAEITNTPLALRALVSQYHRMAVIGEEDIFSGETLHEVVGADCYDLGLLDRDLLVYVREKSIFTKRPNLLAADKKILLPQMFRHCCYDEEHSTTAETVSMQSTFMLDPSIALPAPTPGVNILSLQLSRVTLQTNFDSILRASSVVVNRALGVDERVIEKMVWWHGRLQPKQHRPRSSGESQASSQSRKTQSMVDGEAKLGEGSKDSLVASTGTIPHDPFLLMACKMFVGRREIVLEVKRCLRAVSELASSDLRRGIVELVGAFPEFARRNSHQTALVSSMNVLFGRIASALACHRATLLSLASERLAVFHNGLMEVTTAAASAVATSRCDKYWKGEVN